MEPEQGEDLNKKIQKLSKALESSERRADELVQTIASHEDALAWRRKQVEELERKLNIASKQVEAIYAELQGIQASFGWKFVLRVRQIRDSLFPLGTTRRRLFEKIMKLMKGE